SGRKSGGCECAVSGCAFRLAVSIFAKITVMQGTVAITHNQSTASVTISDVSLGATGGTMSATVSESVVRNPNASPTGPSGEIREANIPTNTMRAINGRRSPGSAIESA